MKLISAIVRIALGGCLAGFALLKYLEFKQAIASGATTQIFNTAVSAMTLTLLLIVASGLGVALIVLGIKDLASKQ